MCFLVPRTHTPSPPQPANFVTMTTTNQTTPKKYKRSRTSFSGSKRGNTKASRKAAKAAAEPKTPSPSANTSKKRPRSNSTPPNRHRRRRRRGRPLLLLSPRPFSLQQMSFEGLVRICGGEQPPIPAAKMTFVLVLGRNGKTSSLLSSRPTCCVPSPSVEESMSYSTTRKNGRTCSNISRSIVV